MVKGDIVRKKNLMLASVEGTIFSLRLLYSIEFANELDALSILNNTYMNPFRITPLCVDKDTSIESWIKQIFTDVHTIRVSWKEVGIKQELPSTILDKFPDSVLFKFGRKACASLDCFGFVDKKGTLCSAEKHHNVNIDFNGNKVTACQPICYAMQSNLKQTHQSGNVSPKSCTHMYTYFDETLGECRQGVETMRYFALVPGKRSGEEEIVDGMFSLAYDTQAQRPLITPEYCEQYKGESYVANSKGLGGDCYLPKSQSVFEFFLGKSIVRRFLMMNRGKNFKRTQTMLSNVRQFNTLSVFQVHNEMLHSIDSSSRGVHGHEASNRSDTVDNVVATSVVDKSDTLASNYEANEATQILPSDDDDALHSKSSNTVGIKFNAELDYEIDFLAHFTQMTSYMVSLYLAKKFGPQMVLSLAAHFDSGVLKLIGNHCLGSAMKRGAIRLTTYLTLKSIAITTATVTSQLAELVSETLNPALWAVELIQIVGFLAEIIDKRFHHVFEQKHLDALRDVMVTKWNALRGRSMSNNKQHAFIRVDPCDIHSKLFGQQMLLKDSKRYSDDRLKTFFYYVDLYTDARNSDDEVYIRLANERFEHRHLKQLHHEFMSGLLNNNMIEAEIVKTANLNHKVYNSKENVRVRYAPLFAFLLSTIPFTYMLHMSNLINFTLALYTLVGIIILIYLHLSFLFCLRIWVLKKQQRNSNSILSHDNNHTFYNGDNLSANLSKLS